MKTTKEELDQLLPSSDEDYVLERIPREERLFRYHPDGGMPTGTKQLPQEWIDAIQKIGLIE